MTTRAFALVALATLVLSTPAFGQSDDIERTVTKRGTTAADFLTIPVGARATGMGGAVTALVDDATAIYWNPAGLARAGAGFLGENANWLAGINFNFAAVTLPIGEGTVGIGVTMLTTPEMEVTTVSEPNGTGETFDAASYAVSLSYARALTDRFSIGASIKRIDERIWTSKASGTAFDIGTMFVTPFRGIRLGASISNFGTKMQITGDDLLVRVDTDPNNRGNNESNRALLKTDEFDIPLTMRIGLSGEVFQSETARFTLAAEALNPNNSEQYVNLGAEVGLLGDLVMLRAGMSEIFVEDAVRSFSVGAGLRYRFSPLNLAVDYAYEAQEYFDDVNRLTLAVGF